jgi:hypothetical protein
MSHLVTGIVGTPDALERFAREESLHRPIPLSQGFSILPLREQDIQSVLGVLTTGHADGFNYYSEQLVDVLCSASIAGPLVFFETEYFGSSGSQGAALFNNGSVVYGPSSAESGPINEALSLLGVQVHPPATDEFESIGLHSYRSTEAWLTSSAAT